MQTKGTESKTPVTKKCTEKNEDSTPVTKEERLQLNIKRVAKTRVPKNIAAR
jgi:hypothetical protein